MSSLTGHGKMSNNVKLHRCRALKTNCFCYFKNIYYRDVRKRNCLLDYFRYLYDQYLFCDGLISVFNSLLSGGPDFQWPHVGGMRLETCSNKNLNQVTTLSCETTREQFHCWIFAFYVKTKNSFSILCQYGDTPPLIFLKNPK